MDAAEPFNVPVDPVALGIPVSVFCTHDFLLLFSFEMSEPHSKLMHGMTIPSI
jgi:hypothetical protein